MNTINDMQVSNLIAIVTNPILANNLSNNQLRQIIEVINKYTNQIIQQYENQKNANNLGNDELINILK